MIHMYVWFGTIFETPLGNREKAISERKETEPYLNRAVERTLQRRHEKREIYHIPPSKRQGLRPRLRCEFVMAQSQEGPHPLYMTSLR